MCDGACIVAVNSGPLDYVSLAAINAQLIKKHLGLPVCLITTDTVVKNDFDHVVTVDAKLGSKRSMLSGQDILTYEWHNDHRIDAIKHSPWDRTLLIDADYLVMTDALLALINSDRDFLIIDEVYDVTGRNSFASMRYLPDGSIKQRWATVMAFNRQAQHVFDAAAMVRDNYAYYAAMFDWSHKPFRNDYAFTVACHLLEVSTLPMPMAQLPPDCSVTVTQHGLRIEGAGKVMRWNSDLHVLNKQLAMHPGLLRDLLHG